MPVMNGLEATIKINAFLSTKNLRIPVIACTAFTTKREID